MHGTFEPRPARIVRSDNTWSFKPGLLGEVETLKGEEKLRHASLKRAWRPRFQGFAVGQAIGEPHKLPYSP